MLYYQTKFGCKPTSSLEDTAEIVISWLYKPSLWPWHSTKWTNFSAWHSGLWCCIPMPRLITKYSVVHELSRQALTFQTFTVTLTLNEGIPFFHRTVWLMMLYYQTKFGCKWTSSLEDIVKIVIFWLYKPSLWLWHWTQWTNFFCMALWLMMLHNHTKFGNKYSAVQEILSRHGRTHRENIILTNVHWHLEPLLWPWPWMQ